MHKYRLRGGNKKTFKKSNHLEETVQGQREGNKER